MAKYCQDNKERLQKKACERYQNLSKEGKKTSDNMILNDTKIYQKMWNKNWLSTKKYYKMRKNPLLEL